MESSSPVGTTYFSAYKVNRRKINLCIHVPNINAAFMVEVDDITASRRLN